MKKFFLLPVLAFALMASACTTSMDFSKFFGSNNPCQAAENIHSAFLIVASTQKISKEALAAERAGIAAIREYCSAGNPEEINLNKLVNAYAAAVNEYKAGAK